MNPTNIRSLLKYSKLHKYIPHTNQIYITLTKSQLPHISENEINKMIYWFRLIDNNYNSIDKERSSFFNYNFIIIMLLKKLGR